jgi:hypothetical protein
MDIECSFHGPLKGSFLVEIKITADNKGSTLKSLQKDSYKRLRNSAEKKMNSGAMKRMIVDYHSPSN